MALTKGKVMKLKNFFLIIFILTLVFCVDSFASVHSKSDINSSFLSSSKNKNLESETLPLNKSQIKESFGNTPLLFEKNLGQTNKKVEFLSRGPGYNLFLKSNETVLSMTKRSNLVTDKETF